MKLDREFNFLVKESKQGPPDFSTVVMLAQIVHL